MRLVGNKAWKRTRYCGELRLRDKGKEVILFGWVHRHRDIGNLVFIDLRDREGIVQIVFSPKNQSLLEEAKKLRMESIIGIKGVVRERGKDARNPALPTGEIEVVVEEMKILSRAKTPPFVLSDPPQASEELRFKYRYLDLRRQRMQYNLKLRHQVALCVRNYLSKNGFLEVETPFLTKSTPEGARDYLVPSRVHRGKFYALPQSPQLFKQILMISGVERYFQIVRCFRDEDLRADRQPEFTQIDIEMSFVEMEDIFCVVERMMAAIFELIEVRLETPFPRLTYQESLERYGTDKPDIRFGNEIRDVTNLLLNIEHEGVMEVLTRGGVARALYVEGGGGLSRSQLEKIANRAKELGAKNFGWIKKVGEFKASLKISEENRNEIWKRIGAKDGDLVFIVADKREIALQVLGELRKDFLPPRFKHEREFRFAWITDFPLFEWSKEEGRLVSMHHPFTAPLDEDLHLLDENPLEVRAKAYDLVLNGVEVGGGSIRIHDVELQKRIFEKLGLSQKEIEEKFGFFLEALSYGAPPHGGIALGFDRMVMILAGEESIREVIPFPKTTSALCLLTNSPSEVDFRQIEELGLKKID